MSATPNFSEIKTRQQAMWASGDYAVIGTTLQPIGEALVEAAGVQAGQRVLDVACGNGNATLAAARRHADVTGLDYVPALLDRANARAIAEGITLKLVAGDAEALPFVPASFDTVLSTVGVMFAPNQTQVARELSRVTAPGGTIAVANWTPEGFIGQFFRIVGSYAPPPAGVASPLLWGKEEHLASLFEGKARLASATRKHFTFHYLSAHHFIDVFRSWYGPTYKAFAGLDAQGQAALYAELVALVDKNNRAGQNACAVPSEYLEVVLKA